MPEKHPPKWALGFLRWYCREEYLDEIEGDLVELYIVRCRKSARSAKLFFLWNVLRSLRFINLKGTQINNWTMNLLGNYSKIYFRRFRKESVHYTVNILGLGLGFTILFCILMFVYDEQNIDAYHSKKDQAYRLVTQIEEEDGVHQYVSTAGPFAQALKEEFPAIKETAHLTYTGSQVLAVGDKRIADREWAVGTPSVFDILDFEVVSGNPKKTFSGQAGIVLTEDMAIKLFDKTDVVGEVVDESNFGSPEVLAVIKEMPLNSTYRFNAIYVANYDQWSDRFRDFVTNNWGGRFGQTWVLFNEGKGPQDIEAFKGDFLDKHLPEDLREGFDYYFQNIQDMHLASEGIEAGGMNPRLTIQYSSQEFVSMILMMGFLVLFIAALNYVNLSSVQALKRTLEASMRKINGANNKQLVGQLFFETFLTVFIAYLVSLILVNVFFTSFLDVANKEFSRSLLFSLDFIPYHIFSIVLIWLLSAFVPSLYYSRLKRNLLVLKNAFSGKGDMLRKALVGVQYVLSIFLIIGSIVIYRQLEFVQSKNLGFDQNNLIVLDINSGTARRSFKEILDGLKKNANVVNASTSSRVPGEWKNIPTANLTTALTGEPVEASHYGVDKEWLDTYGMKLIEGENFKGLDQVDSLNIIINRQVATMLELENPIGESVWVMNNRDSVKMKIIGIVEDFHFESLYEPIGPVFLTSWNNHVRSIDYFTIRYNQNPKETIDHIVEVNATFDPETPAEINFLDVQWERFYQSEESRSTIMLIASIVSIIISAFGLFGLINFTAERKTKEIGIRKVMGATIPNIINLIMKDYLILLIISLLIAIPIAYLLFSDWLADFAYRIALSLDIFLISFVLVAIISLSTVMARIFRIAKANPVNSIRYE